MKKNIRVSFVKVEMPADAGKSFLDILREVGQMTYTARNVSVNGDVIRLQEFEEINGCVDGQMIRIRMHEVPLKASKTGELGSIQLLPDEGVGEPAAFLYDPKRNALVFQRNHIGVSPSKMAYYFGALANLGGPIEFSPVLRLDAVKRLAKMDIIRRMEFKIAGSKDFKVWAGLGHRIDEAVNLQEQLKAPHVTVVASIGPKKGTMPPGLIKKMIQKLLRISSDHPSEVEQLRIVGKADDEPRSSPLDLLEELLEERVSVQLDDESRTLPYADRREAVRKAWEQHAVEL